MIEIECIINFKLNLFFHLEVLSGSVPQRYSKKYTSKYPEFVRLAKEFKWEFEPQTISWNFKNRIVKKRVFEEGGLAFGKKIKHIYIKAMKLYKPYWDSEIKEKLEKFKVIVEKKKKRISRKAEKIEKFTGFKFKKRKIKIYLIEALSQEYGIGGEPLDEGVAIGIVKDEKLLEMIIVHELVHLNLMDRIIKRIPIKYKKDESKINEAITNLITHRVLNLPLSKKDERLINYFKKIKK